jgi:hypothetical protein
MSVLLNSRSFPLFFTPPPHMNPRLYSLLRFLFLSVAFLALARFCARSAQSPSHSLFAYYSLLLLLLPLLFFTFPKTPLSLYSAILLGEFYFWTQNLLLWKTTPFLLLGLWTFQECFHYWRSRYDETTAVTGILFLYYFSFLPLFLTNDLLYHSSESLRPYFLYGLFNSNPWILLIQSILEEPDFFRSFWMYHYLSDIGSHYPHHALTLPAPVLYLLFTAIAFLARLYARNTPLENISPQKR